MKQSILILLFSLSSMVGFSQGFNIKVEVNGLTNDTIYLANYFGKKMFYADTAYVNKKGVATFEGKEPFKAGKYAIVFPGPSFIDLLLDDQIFEVKTDTTDLIKNIEIKGSSDNEVYYDYILFINDRKNEVAEIKSKIEGLDKDSEEYKKLSEQVIKIDERVKQKQLDLFNNHKGALVSVVIGMTLPPEIPDPPKDENGVITDSLFQYKYYINHYFDNTPFDDPRIVRTPEYDRKLDAFFNKALPQSPDTLIKHADRILPQVRHDSDLYKFTLHFITYNFQSSKYMGMDKGYVHMIENYYTKGGITWMDSTKLADIIEEAMLIKPTLIGNIAPNFRLHDTTATKFTTLSEVKSDYTLIYIWQPECGHCKKTNPKLVDLNKKYEGKGLTVLPISVDFENDKWLEYLRDNPEFAKLNNMSDSPEHPSNFRSLYNSKTTPTILLLDKDKKIIAKKLDIEQLDTFLERSINKK